MRIKKTSKVVIGQRFRPCQAFQSQLWEVEYLYVDAQGIPHTRLFDISTPSTKRTVATAVLLDSSRFKAVVEEE